MIQTALIFILGFLSAVFVAVLVAPAIWRRAVALTHRRIEAALPLSLNEIRAEKDALRAGHAMAVRKLEVTVEGLRERLAAQSVDADRARDDAGRSAHRLDERAATIAHLETQQGALRADLVKGEKEIARLMDAIAERDAVLDERAHEIRKLGHMYDEASLDASSRQIEMAAQESNLEKLSEELSLAREAGEKAEALLRQAEIKAGEQDEALRAEKRRIITLERRIETLTAALSDHEEKLERRGRDVERLREKLRAADEAGRAVAAARAAAQDKAARLEGELALQTRENKALRAVQEKKWAAANGEGDNAGSGVETALLRERIDALAAEVVSLTASIEGPDSEIGRLIAAEPARGRGGKAEQQAPSLAGRIAALRQAAGSATGG